MFAQSLYIQTTDSEVVSTASESSALNSPVPLPAGFWSLGRSVRVQMQGDYQTPLVGAEVTVRIKHGSTVIASSVTTALLSSSDTWLLDSVITSRSSGQLVSRGIIQYQAATRVFDKIVGMATIDPAPADDFDITVQWDSASADRSILTQLAVFEYLS